MSAQIETNIKVEFKSRDRISVLFRLILVAPIAIFESSFSISDASNGWPTAFLVLPALLALVFVRSIQVMYLALIKRFLGFQIESSLLCFYFKMVIPQLSRIQELK